MSNTTQQEKAEQRRQQFSNLLKEMFQLNQPELDFGLYRIMHARKDDITKFIEQDLPAITRKAFEQFSSQDKTQLEAALQQARKAAQDAGFDADDSPRVKEIQAQLQSGFDLSREEGDVYDALVTFFGRYYSEGDFLSRRVYKDGTYAIPYQGEEVVLHWANKDQYYIKSSETLRDYAFRLIPDAGPNEDPMRVHFKLVDAEAGAKENNKESAESKRVFILDRAEPFEIIDGEPSEDGSVFKELQIRFFYRAATRDDWSEDVRSGATAAAKNKPPTQDHLRSIAVQLLLTSEDGLPEPWRGSLSSAYIKSDGDTADYSLLQGQLNNYTKKNTFDYFIHKNLGGFLTEELDFYVKNELLDWSDVAALKNDVSRLAPLISKVEVIRDLGEKIIAFLAQLEGFQKKLWLKKKFVTRTNYCMTLDRIEDSPALIAEVFACAAQLEDWAHLYNIDLSQLSEDLGPSPAKTEYEGLLKNPDYRFLMFDTKNFDEKFKANLLATISDLDEQTDGLLIHSENFQALDLLQARYRGQVKCIYIDPPYNTGTDGFAYKDAYQSSSWLTMMENRLVKSRNLLAEDGVLFSSISEIERTQLEHALRSCFGPKNRIEELIWVQDTVSNNAPAYSTNHEYIEVFAKNREQSLQAPNPFRVTRPGYTEVMDIVRDANSTFESIETVEKRIKSLYKAHKEAHIAAESNRGLSKEEAQNSDPWKGIYPYTNAEYRSKQGAYVPSHQAKEVDADLWVWRKVEPSMPSGKQAASTKDPKSDNYRHYQVTNPENKKVYSPPKRGWAFPLMTLGTRPSFQKYLEDNRIWFGESGVPQQKYFLHEVGLVVSTSILRQYANGEPELEKVIGSKGLVSNPKPPRLIQTLLQQTTKDDELVLDFFAGSGTTAQAVHAQNRFDGGHRKYVLIESEKYFSNVLMPRVMKTAYGENWTMGGVSNEVDANSGISHSFKYLELEAYEDTLQNLELSLKTHQRMLMSNNSAEGQTESERAYLLKYSLDLETRNSPSLLNIEMFSDPENYRLKVRSATGDETRNTKIDLLETFNFLLGLRVEHIAVPIHFDAKFSQSEFGRWQADVKRVDDGRWWFRTVYGTNPNGQEVLVVWRNMPPVLAEEEDGLIKDNAVLDAVLIEKLNIRLTASEDDEVDILYVNGDNNISIPRNRKGEPMEEARLQLIEEAFHELMFAGAETALG